MSTTINLTNVIAAKGYGGADLVAIYGQGGVKIWEAGEPDYSKKYLTFIALSNGTFAFEKQNNNTISYSTDNGKTWSTPSGDVTINVNAGDKVLWKAQFVSNSAGSGSFSGSTATYDIEGNILSLIYGDNFRGQTTFRENSGLINMFMNTKCIDASNLILAPENMTNGSYAQMFQGCTMLETAPEMPATILSSCCYQRMFKGCTSLSVAPEFHATSLGTQCCESMYEGCTALETAPSILPATSFAGVSATYATMFTGCTSLTTAPELPVTTLGTTCYTNMFKNCTHLNYVKMYATDISAYRSTENFLSNVAATGIFVKNINATWTGVVPTGWTLIYYDSITDKYYLSDKTTECDDHGNPPAHNYANDPFTIVAKSGGNIVLNKGSYTILAGGDHVERYYKIEYSTDGVHFLYSSELNPDLTISVQTGDEILIRFDMCSVIDNPDVDGWIPLIGDDGFSQSTADFEVQGNIMSLVYGDSFIGETSFPDPAINFYAMFRECQTLLNAENLILPATTVTDSCYTEMFSGCTSLTTAPALPATTLEISCYNAMFSGCESLTTAPALPATTLADMCYWYMFSGCLLLSHITMLATDISAEDCLTGWVDGVAATGTFVKASSMNSLTTGGDGIPSGWNIQDAN